MRTGTINFVGFPDYDDDCTFTVAVIADGLSAAITFFDYIDAFQNFGEALTQFPFNNEQEVLFQFGEDIGWEGGFLHLKAYCIDPMGNTALQIIIDNCEKLPRKRRIEFSVLAEPASLNELGRKLMSWDLKANGSLEWKAQTS